MRRGEAQHAVEAADRALSIAELDNLEAVVAEAFVNKGAGLSQLGRRRESISLHAVALELATRLPDRAFEMRARNNYASVLSDDDPLRAAAMILESLELARDLGDRGMYNWLLGNATSNAFTEGRDWDRFRALLAEAFDAKAVALDRGRLRTFIGLIDLARGERVAETVDELERLLGGRDGVDAQFMRLMVNAEASLVLDDPVSAHRYAIEAWDLHSQNQEIPAATALHAAIAVGDPELIRSAAGIVAQLRASGAWTLALRRHAQAALDALDGKTAEAESGFAAAHRGLLDLGQRYDAAPLLVDALTMLPGNAELRRLAPETRQLLETLRARPLLARLDSLLAQGERPPTPATSRLPAAPVETVSE